MVMWGIYSQGMVMGKLLLFHVVPLAYWTQNYTSDERGYHIDDFCSCLTSVRLCVAIHWLLDSYLKVDMRSVMCTGILVHVVHLKVRQTLTTLHKCWT